MTEMMKPQRTIFMIHKPFPADSTNLKVRTLASPCIVHLFHFRKCTVDIVDFLEKGSRQLDGELFGPIQRQFRRNSDSIDAAEAAASVQTGPDRR